VKSVLTGQTTSYSYDGQNQLVGATMPSGNASYQYDAQGRRVERTTNTAVGAPIYYVYDNQDIVAMVDGSGSLIGLFTRGPNIDEPLEIRQVNGAEYFIHADALGSIVAHTDNTGTVVERIEYEAYGQPMFLDLRSGSPVVESQSFTGDPFAFTGRDRDHETGQYNYRKRQTYDAIIGRFCQPDPIGIKGGIDLYTYVSGNPVTRYDPNGTVVFAPASIPPDIYLPPSSIFPNSSPFPPGVPLPQLGPPMSYDIAAVDQCVQSYLNSHYPPQLLWPINHLGTIMPIFDATHGEWPSLKNWMEIGGTVGGKIGIACVIGETATTSVFGPMAAFANTAQGLALNSCLQEISPWHN
jgi:RHS repeat-associated protein